MGFLSKIFHQQQPTTQIQINIFDRNALLTNTDIKKIRQLARTYYHDSSSEDKVVSEIKKATGLKSGRVTLEYDKHKNRLNIFYCCSPF